MSRYILIGVKKPLPGHAPHVSGPADFRGQAHQNGFDVAAGFQAESSAAVVQQVEFDVAAAPDQLMLALRAGP